jgi:ketosteroid isomerase-like protein
VLESVMSGTVAAPIAVGGEQVEATGARVAVDFLDVIVVEDGLIARKDSYLDTLAFERQLGGGS